MQVDRLPVFYKQRLEGLHPAWAYTLPITFLRIFYSLTEAGIWSIIVYWLVGFAPDAGRFAEKLLIPTIKYSAAQLTPPAPSRGHILMS